MIYFVPHQNIRGEIGGSQRQLNTNIFGEGMQLQKVASGIQ
jgi:hypothetical protein